MFLGLEHELLAERIELKAVEELLSYLRLSGYPVGLLIDFRSRRLREGIRRFVETQPKNPPASSAVDLRKSAIRP